MHFSIFFSFTLALFLCLFHCSTSTQPLPSPFTFGYSLRSILYIHYSPRIGSYYESHPSLQLRFSSRAHTIKIMHTHTNRMHIYEYTRIIFMSMCACALDCMRRNLNEMREKQHNSILLGFSVRCVWVCVCVCLCVFCFLPQNRLQQTIFSRQPV